jgi:hypothetical protein
LIVQGKITTPLAPSDYKFGFELTFNEKKQILFFVKT